jgi:hypothetical protein
MAQNIYPNNYAPQTKRSTVSHLPGQTTGSHPTDGRDYSVEFDDSLMSYDGWTNPRHDGCKTQALYVNKYSAPGTPIQVGGFKHHHIQNLSNVTRSWTGDVNVNKTPVLRYWTTSLFFGSTIAGFDEDPQYPGVGNDFSSIFVNKIYTFDPHTDEFFITEILDGCKYDEVFERMLKQDMRYADKFAIRILDETTEHDLNFEYNVHYNRGLFSKIATFVTCSDPPYSCEMQLNTQYSPFNQTKDTYRDFYGLPISASKGLLSQNNVPFFWNGHNRKDVTGSFTINSTQDTWWWRKPQSSSFFNATLGGGTYSRKMKGATDLNNLRPSADGTGSVYQFFSRLFSRKGAIISGSGDDSDLVGSRAEKDDLLICTFNNAENCDKRIQTEQRYGRNITQALRHFGSISLSHGREIGVPNISLRRPHFNNLAINSKIVGPSFTQFVTSSSHPAPHSESVNHIYYTWFNNASSSAYAALNACDDEAIQVEAPRIKTYVISQLKKRSNVIMADLNKNEQLFDGVGSKGFVLLHEDLHPMIKTNIDYYLNIADLIENGPTVKNPVNFPGREIIIPRPWGGDQTDNLGGEDPC